MSTLPHSATTITRKRTLTGRSVYVYGNLSIKLETMVYGFHISTSCLPSINVQHITILTMLNINKTHGMANERVLFALFSKT